MPQLISFIAPPAHGSALLALKRICNSCHLLNQPLLFVLHSMPFPFCAAGSGPTAGIGAIPGRCGAVAHSDPLSSPHPCSPPSVEQSHDLLRPPYPVLKIGTCDLGQGFDVSSRIER